MVKGPVDSKLIAHEFELFNHTEDWISNWSIREPVYKPIPRVGDLLFDYSLNFLGHFLYKIFEPHGEVFLPFSKLFADVTDINNPLTCTFIEDLH